MWGVERLWTELLLIAAALSSRWRFMPPLLLITYGVALYAQREAETPLFHFSTPACEMLIFFSTLTAGIWLLHPLHGASAWALMLLMGSYSLLLRSQHLAFTWGLMESAALGGYFFVAGEGKSAERWNAVIRYLIWSISGSAMFLLGIGARLTADEGLAYPLTTGGLLADTLVMMGWAVKVGFIPWHFWLMGIYRVLPLSWGGWFAVVPKGALLLNLISALPSEEVIQLTIFRSLGALSLLGAYALAWRAQHLTDMIFWGSFAQGAYIVLATTAQGAFAGWEFWMVYSVATLLSLLYAEKPWQGDTGSTIGLLLVANLAALPPVWGFWAKLQLFWVGLTHLSGWMRWVLLSAALLATIGGFAVYGKLLWSIWQGKEPTPPLWRKLLYLFGALGLLSIGLRGLSSG